MLNLPPNTEIFVTGDGSPTLSFARPDGYREKMHHSAGALGESLYIYHHALRLTLAADLTPRVLSVGLGLAYNELLTTAEMVKRGRIEYKIWSFEALPELREGFRQWIGGESDGELASVLESAAEMVAAHFDIPLPVLKWQLHNSLQDGRLELRGSFPQDSDLVSANTVFYDAYSRKMDESLWEEQALYHSLEKILQPDCVLATYAATGSLNRSLRRLGFRLSDKTGFMGKRESTMAIRGAIG